MGCVGQRVHATSAEPEVLIWAELPYTWHEAIEDCLVR